MLPTVLRDARIKVLRRVWFKLLVGKGNYGGGWLS